LVRVTRPHHLAALADAFADAAHGRCTVAVIEGERGIGKTTVCEAFMEYAEGVPSTRVCYGQSFPHASVPAPYSAMAAGLRPLLRQSPATIEPLLALHAPLWLDQMRPYAAADQARPDGGADPVRRV